MRVIHNNLQRACESSPPASVMDRLRNNLNQLCPLLRARYRKLFDDYASSKENIPLLIQSKDYISYSCSCCGRTQKLQAEELNAIVGSAFRLAYAARLQRSARGHGAVGDASACCAPETAGAADTKANGRTWGRRSRQSSRRGGKSVNLASSSAGSSGGEGSGDQQVCRPPPELRLTTGYVNEAVSSTDSESRSGETQPRPLSAASNSSLREDSKSCQWSSASSCGSGWQAPPYYQQGPSPELLQLRSAAWFQAGIPREIALEVLSQEPVGAFMVRESTTKHGCYALSLRVPRDFQVSGIAHYLILNTAKGYKIKGFMKEFASLTALITHHSVMPELLPCTLSLSRYNPDFARSESSDMVELDTPDSEYNGLSQLSSTTEDTTV